MVSDEIRIEGKRRKLSAAKTTELNEAIRVLHNYCAAGVCNGCPFRKDKTGYGTSCRFGSFYPELWDDLEIKENDYAD